LKSDRDESMESKEITEALFELIGLTATELPEDVTAALGK